MKEKASRRGPKKGFIEGSSNYRLSQVIPQELAEYGALTREDLHALLRVARTWLVRPLARLQEQGVIIRSPTTCVCEKGIACTDCTFHLPGQSPVPDYLKPLAVEDIRGPRGVEGSGSVVASPGAAPGVVTIAEETGVGDDCAACEQIGVGRGACSSCASRALSSPRSRSRS